MTDTNGNLTHYSYFEDTEKREPLVHTEPFTKKYINQILYTDHEQAPSLGNTLRSLFRSSLTPAYKVEFGWDCERDGYTQRRDVSVTTITGFKVVTRCLLEDIRVALTATNDEDTTIRSYRLAYTQGFYFKQLLSSVSVFGSDGGEFYSHSFDYSQPEFLSAGNVEGGSIPMFAEPQLAPLENSPNASLARADHKLSYSSKDNHSGSAGVGINAQIGPEGGAVGCAIGVNLGGSYSEGNTLYELTDVNGDRIPDRIRRSDRSAR